jgi:serine/threonine-protein kinase
LPGLPAAAQSADDGGAMSADAEELKRLSALLDPLLELEPGEPREAWLAALTGDDAALVPRLRRLLDSAASSPTAGALDLGAARAADSSLLGHRAGESVGPYRLLSVLGRGGMGEVWLAERADGQMQRQVALKLPLLGLRREVLVQRFARERDILASLNHPHIARLYDAGLAGDGQPYLALEYVPGQPIDAWCRARAVPLAERVRLLLQAAAAVAYAHTRLVLHRDLKPGNIHVTADGEVKLLDFGIAKLMEGEHTQETLLTREGGRAFTPDYASPEQVRGEALGTASDVYSMGMVAFEVLSDARPYRLKRGSAAEVEEAILNAEPALASTATGDATLRRALHGDLDAILQQALRKEPQRRYASVEAFADDLSRWQRGLAVRARAASRLERSWRWAVRNKVLAGATAAVFVSTVGGSVVATWQAMQARRQAERAEAASALARDESRRAQAVQAFMLDIFRANSVYQPDPQRAQRTTARELLDLGAERAAQSLKDAPSSHIDVLGTLGELYLQLGLPSRAEQQFRQRVELARRALAPDDPRRAQALQSLAGRLYDGAGREEARRLLAEAEEVLDAAGDHQSATRASLLFMTARFNRFESMREALSHAQSALTLYRQRRDDAGTLRALSLLGALRMMAGDLAGAEVAITEAREFAARDANASKALLINATADLGEAQQARGRFAAAEASLRAALASAEQVSGVTHPVTMVFRIQLSNFLFEVGRQDEALQLQAAVRKAAREGEFEPGWIKNAEHLMARTLYDRGLPQAMHNAQRPGIVELRGELPHSGALAQRERMFAELQSALGQHNEAEATLAEATRRWLAFMQGELRPSSMNSFRLAAAKLHLAQGRFDAALAALDEVAATSGVEPGAVDVALLRRDTLRAEIFRRLDRLDDAQHNARAALARLVDVPAPYRLGHHEANAMTVLGRIQQAQGDLAAAQTSLEQALALRQAHESPQSLWLADGQEALADCLRARGRSAQAQAWMAAAARIRRQVTP